MGEIAGILAYGMQYEKLDLKLFKEKRWNYEYAKLSIMIEEFQKGFYCGRWNKATKKGTNTFWKVIKSKKQSDLELEKIESYMNEVNKEFGFSFKFERQQTIK